MDRKTIANRIKNIRRAYKNGEFIQADFANLLSIPETTYKSLEVGRAPLTIDKINIFKEKIGVSPLWLLYGEGSMFLNEETSTDVFIPYYDDIRASAGFGALNGDLRDPEYIQLPKSLLSSCSRSATEAIRCSGDSMTPYLKDGDVMFIDKSKIEVKDGDVYVVRFEEDLFVKRLFRLPGKLIAKSDNPIYPEFDLTSDFEVLGKVIYKMERI